MSSALVRRNPINEAELKQLASFEIKSADNWNAFIQLATKVATDELMEANSSTQAGYVAKVAPGIISGGQQSIYNKQSIEGLITDEAADAATGKMKKIDHFDNYARILESYGAKKTAKAVKKVGRRFSRSWPLIIGLSVGGAGLLGLGVWYFFLRNKE